MRSGRSSRSRVSGDCILSVSDIVFAQCFQKLFAFSIVSANRAEEECTAQHGNIFIDCFTSDIFPGGIFAGENIASENIAFFRLDLSLVGQDTADTVWRGDAANIRAKEQNEIAVTCGFLHICRRAEWKILLRASRHWTL